MNIEIPSLLPVISDFIFKLIFGDQRNADILAEFLKSVLDIPDSEYDHITVVDPHVKKEAQNDKYGILDVKVHTKSGMIINVEIQVLSIPEMKQRSIFFMSKMITEQMAAGRKHSDVKRSVCIIITNYTFVPKNDRYRDGNAGTVLPFHFCNASGTAEPVPAFQRVPILLQLGFSAIFTRSNIARRAFESRSKPRLQIFAPQKTEVPLQIRYFE